MRWDDLFADLGGRADAVAAGELAAEVEERTRTERSAVTLASRLRQARGAVLSIQLLGGAALAGPLRDGAAGWFVLGGDSPGLVPVGAVTVVRGLPPGSRAEGGVADRRPLSWALRVVARDRSPVRVHTVDGRVVDGTVDAVADDHVQVGEHPIDLPRRASAVRSVATIRLDALALVQPASHRSTLG